GAGATTGVTTGAAIGATTGAAIGATTGEAIGATTGCLTVAASGFGGSAAAIVTGCDGPIVRRSATVTTAPSTHAPKIPMNSTGPLPSPRRPERGTASELSGERHGSAGCAGGSGVTSHTGPSTRLRGSEPVSHDGASTDRLGAGTTTGGGGSTAGRGA